MVKPSAPLRSWSSCLAAAPCSSFELILVCSTSSLRLRSSKDSDADENLEGASETDQEEEAK